MITRNVAAQFFNEPIPAAQSRSLLRRGLRGAAYFAAFIELQNEERALFHDPATHIAVSRLPWPLSVLQPHQVELQTRDVNGREHVALFDKGQIDKAIDMFLWGTAADTPVCVESW
jgi:hypothetical protein